MRFLLLTFAPPTSEDVLPDATVRTAVDRFNRALRAAGVLLGTDRLRSTRDRSRGHGAADTGDGAMQGAVSGYWLIQVRSLDEALAWASRCPLAPDEGIDVRQAIPHEASV